jgi:hypothetical protein
LLVRRQKPSTKKRDAWCQSRTQAAFACNGAELLLLPSFLVKSQWRGCQCPPRAPTRSNTKQITGVWCAGKNGAGAVSDIPTRLPANAERSQQLVTSRAPSSLLSAQRRIHPRGSSQLADSTPCRKNHECNRHHRSPVPSLAVHEQATPGIK